MSKSAQTKLVSKSQFAKMLGINPSTITRALQKGRIQLYRDSHPSEYQARLAMATTDREREAGERLGAMIEPKSQEDAFYANSKRRDMTQHQAQLREEVPDGEVSKFANTGNSRIVRDVSGKSLDDYKLDKERESAERIRLQNEKAKGELIPKNVVNKVLFPFIRSIRENVMSIPDRCSALLAASVRGVLPEEVDVSQERLQNTIRNTLRKELPRILQEVTRAEDWEDEAKAYYED